MKTYPYCLAWGTSVISRHRTVSAARKALRRHPGADLCIQAGPAESVRIVPIDPYPGSHGRWLIDGFDADQHADARRYDLSTACAELDQQEPL